MKHLFLMALAATLSLASPVLSADAVDGVPAAPEATEVTTDYSWSGLYLGASAGYGWTRGELSGFGATVGEDFNGGNVGFFAGYNVDLGNRMLVGIEGDVSKNFNARTYSALGLTGELGTDLSASLRGRVGYAMDRALVFGTAGYTATQVSGEALGVRRDRTLHGFTLGAGVDFAITDTVFTRAEYRFNHYVDRALAGGVDLGGSQHQVNIGIGFKF